MEGRRALIPGSRESMNSQKHSQSIARVQGSARVLGEDPHLRRDLRGAWENTQVHELLGKSPPSAQVQETMSCLPACRCFTVDLGLLLGPQLRPLQSKGADELITPSGNATRDTAGPAEPHRIPAL